MENEPKKTIQDDNSPVLIKSYVFLVVNFFFYSVPLHIWDNKYKYLLLIIAIIVARLLIRVGVMYEEKVKEAEKVELEYAQAVDNGKISGYKKPNAKLKTMRNPSETLSTIISTSFDALIKPVNSAIQKQQEIASNLMDSVQSVRKMITHMRNSTKNAMDTAFNELKNLSARFVYLMKKLMAIFKKIFESLQHTTDALKYTSYIMASTWNGPIGGAARFMCFDENTILENNKFIKDIKVGDILNKNCQVISVLKLDRYGNQMYNYNNVIVSGSHSVLENGEWMRVRDTKFAIPIKYNKPFIYCLETTNGEININNTRFKDFYETTNRKLLNNYHSFFKNYINNKPLTYQISKNNYYNSGFSKGTIIKCWRGLKPIEKIIVGDTINGSKVIGIIKTNDPLIKMFSYKNQICSGYNVVYHNNKYEFVKDIGTPVVKNNNTIYQLLTDDNRIIINNIEFRDENIKLTDEIIDLTDDYLDFNSNLETKYDLIKVN